MKLKTHLAKYLEWKMKLTMLEGLKTDHGQLGVGLEVLFPSPELSLLLPYAVKVIMGSWLPPASCKTGQVLLLPVSKLFSINLASQGTSEREKTIFLESKACRLLRDSLEENREWTYCQGHLMAQRS